MRLAHEEQEEQAVALRHLDEVQGNLRSGWWTGFQEVQMGMLVVVYMLGVRVCGRVEAWLCVRAGWRAGGMEAEMVCAIYILAHAHARRSSSVCAGCHAMNNYKHASTLNTSAY